MKDITKIDVAIVGGGIIGLWCAYELLKKNPHQTVAVFEKEMFLGEHTTSRNSEVLHAGIYYQEGSLKHLMCLEGNEIWRGFVKQHNLSFLDSGKYIVSPTADCERLNELYQKARNNKVKGIEFLPQQKIKELQNHLQINSGFSSSSSGVLNVSEALALLSSLIESLGGIILKKQSVFLRERSHNGFIFEASGEVIQSQFLINAAGLFAIDLRSQLGLGGYSNKYVKGNYLILKKSLPLTQLIYPLPPIDGLGLGVHLTMDTSGAQKFGPDTELVDTLNYIVNPDLKTKMFADIKKLFYKITSDDLALGYAGIRPKILDTQNTLVSDFILNTPKEHQIQGYYEFLGIESPGLTAAPALARLLSQKLTN